MALIPTWRQNKKQKQKKSATGIRYFVWRTKTILRRIFGEEFRRRPLRLSKAYRRLPSIRFVQHGIRNLKSWTTSDGNSLSSSANKNESPVNLRRRASPKTSSFKQDLPKAPFDSVRLTNCSSVRFVFVSDFKHSKSPSLKKITKSDLLKDNILSRYLIQRVKIVMIHYSSGKTSKPRW